MNNFFRYQFGILMILVSIFQSLSMISYSVGDILSISDPSTEFKNIFGYYGFIFANFLLQYFGFSAILFIVYQVFFGLKMLTHGKIKFSTIKIFFIFISIVSLSILLSMSFLKKYRYYFEFLPGGYLGLYFYSKLKEIFFDSVIFFISFDLFIACLYFILFINRKNFKKVEKNKKTKSIFAGLLKFVYSIIKILIKIISFPFVVLKFTFMKITSKQRKPEIKVTKKTEEIKKNREYIPPSPELIKNHVTKVKNSNEQFIKGQIEKLSQALADFGVRGEVIGYYQGPVVTTYEFRPLPGIRSSRIIAISDDIARVMMVESVRIFLISGKDSLGVEIANPQRSFIGIREILDGQNYKNSEKDIPLILGVDTNGNDVIANLTDMPHSLVAGTTGSGKSVGINCMVLSILFNLSPNECKLIMIDPKKLEFSLYNDIPHLLMPVVTEAPKAILALKWAVAEMDLRYSKMSSLGVRNINGFNEKIGNEERMPWIVIFIDEMADILLVAGKEFEILVQRLAQMARAAGIHLVMATQRPSVDVITGVIKANFPTRISYRVTSKIDSRTILGEQGAERLLGKGDMLFVPNGTKTIRVHGPFVSDSDIENICNDLRERYKPDYIDLEDFFLSESNSSNDQDQSNTNLSDDIYKQAVDIVLKEKKTSISYIQRKLRIGYNKAANLIEQMEKEGILSEPDSTGKRKII